MDGGHDSLEQFKRRLPLGEIIGRYVKLTRKGREFQGLCPFHQEKSPSFNVVEDKGFYHCFGCGAHGDAIGFIMAIEGLSFPDALTRLSDLSGIEAPKRTSNSPKADPGLIDANAAAARYYHEQLKSSEAASARRYINKRGLRSEAIQTFQIGFAGHARDGLKTWLHERGIGEAVAIEAGLLIKPEDGGQAFDRFRDRLMIPIEDNRGQVVGFGGRALADQKAKYLNSPETPVFHKGEMLYNLKRASVPARQQKRLLVVEGYMDVIALFEGGMPEAVAPLGTAVTEAQLQLMWRVCDTPIVCLDGDRAGRAAALRLARRSLAVIKSGQSLDFAVLPQGEDPDSLIRARGTDAMQGLIRTAMPLSRLIWLEEVNAGPPDTPEALASLRQRLMSYVQVTEDAGLKQALKDQFYALLDARRPNTRWSKGRRAMGKSAQPGQGKWEGSGNRLGATLQAFEARRDGRLLGYFLRSPELLDLYGENLALISFDDPLTERARQEIVHWYTSSEHLDGDALRHHLTVHGYERVVELATNGIGISVQSTSEDVCGEIEQLFDVLRAGAAKRQSADELASEITDRSVDDVDATRRALDQLMNSGGNDAG